MRAKIGRCVMERNIAYLLHECLQSLILLHVLKSSKSEKHSFKPILRQTAKIYPVRLMHRAFLFWNSENQKAFLCSSIQFSNPSILFADLYSSLAWVAA